MDNRKIYIYHPLTTIDISDSVEWARENFQKYDGETSPLWNEHVKQEFARLNAERKTWCEDWEQTFRIIAADIEMMA